MEPTSMTKKKTPGPNFIATLTAPMSVEDQDELFAHIILYPGVYQEAMGRLSLENMHGEPYPFLLLFRACQRLRQKKPELKPGKKKFRLLLKDEVRGLGQELAGDEVAQEEAE